jgi:hypothetical protein
MTYYMRIATNTLNGHCPCHWSCNPRDQIRTYIAGAFWHLKCIAQFAITFHVEGLGLRVRKFISRCDICQRVKHPKRSCAVQNLSHLPTKLGYFCAIDFNGRYLLEASGFDIHLYLSTCFRNFESCTHWKLQQLRLFLVPSIPLCYWSLIYYIPQHNYIYNYTLTFRRRNFLLNFSTPCI